MMVRRGLSMWFLVPLLVAGVAAAGGQESRLVLRDAWTLQSSRFVKVDGSAISKPGFATRGWYETSVPATVLAALVAGNVYPDPYFGMNLRSIPGASYPIGRNFSKLPMPPESPFLDSWWYRTEFEIPASDDGRRLHLHFDGINFRANVWLNGRLLAGSDVVVGAYRAYELEITGVAHVGAMNALAVEVFPPYEDDLALTWVDWNPMAPDKAMGLWRGVRVTTSGPVTLRHPHVVSDLDLPSLETARLTVFVDMRNASDREVVATLRGTVAAVQVTRQVQLAPHEARTVRLGPDELPELALSQPGLWWPMDMGPQNLHDLELEVVTADGPSDRTKMRFGIREITSELTAEGHRLFRVNGRPVLVRGGGWTPDMLLRFDPERVEAELAYVRDLHLNTIRLEGKMEPEPFFELADRYGILIMAGWCCCHHWERWSEWTEEDHTVAAESLRSQILRLRAHPSLLVWLNGSDFPPPERVERTYLQILEELQWPNPVVSNATKSAAQLSGPSGMKMNGPYDWVPPSYWSSDVEYGGAWGFATEVGTGPQVPPLASLREMLPASSLWPIDEQWSFHAGGGQFRTLDIFNAALSARYGVPAGVEDYAFKAQVMAYEGLRAMFEAFARNKYTATGVIQWMLNDAWPSLIWHLYDYYLRPGGAYFGAKKALEPVHVQFSYDDRSVVVINGLQKALGGVQVEARIFDLEARERSVRRAIVDVPADGAVRAFVIAEPEGLPRTYFLRLELTGAAGALLSSNFYWLSTESDVLDWEASTWYTTPTASYADFTGLESLPPIELRVEIDSVEVGGSEQASVIRVTVENPSPSLAFAVRLRLMRGDGGDEVLPILWQDNYLALLPGESREIEARFDVAALQGSEPVVVVEGWNVGGSRRASPP